VLNKSTSIRISITGIHGVEALLRSDGDRMCQPVEEDRRRRGRHDVTWRDGRVGVYNALPKADRGGRY
jgi:hypothetical protein